ncbi:MAG: GNAT family N-acetyltransferase [Acidimicrobiia bacterium]
MSTMTLTTAAPAPAQERAVAILLTAFAADPLIRWIYPDPATYVTAFPEVLRRFGGEAFLAGTAAIADDHSGAALWLAPDAHIDYDPLVEHFQRTVDRGRVHIVLDLLGEMSEHHPTEPVWYLPFIGVDPAHQGRGVGSELLAAGLARAHRDGLPAYLEASTRRNRALYERHGFTVTGEVRVGDSPPLWPMLREARP